MAAPQPPRRRLSGLRRHLRPAAASAEADRTPLTTHFDEATRTLTVEAEGTPITAAVIFCQGIGTIPATFGPGGGWREVAEYWAASLPWVRFVLPSAPAPNASWFDGLDGLDAARRDLDAVIEREAARLEGGAARVVLSGFSQGAMLSLFAGLLRYATAEPQPPIGGVISLSGMLINKKLLKASLAAGQAAAALAELPLRLTFGTADAMCAAVPVRPLTPQPPHSGLCVLTPSLLGRTTWIS